jgi:drug/metabolite transporter (DMT)-like permease
MVAPRAASEARAAPSRENLGMALGLLAVAAFALTLPITRYLTGYLSVWEIGLGRTTVAAVAAVGILVATRQPLPSWSDTKKLMITASGISFGFPLLTALGMETVPASHGGIVLGGLPLATAIIGCFLAGERPSLKFWLVALLGFGLVVLFSAINHRGSLDLNFYVGDLALLGAVLMAGLGYAQGGVLARTLGGWQVICWTLTVSLPLVLLIVVPMSSLQDFQAMPATGWAAFLFLALVNSLVGFFFWYRGLALGGIARVSQIQLLQPFFTFLFAVLFLGEAASPVALVFTVLIVATVVMSKRTPIARK